MKRFGKALVRFVRDERGTETLEWGLVCGLIVVGAIALVVVLSAGAWLSRSLLGPLRDLTAGVEHFTAGDLPELRRLS